MKLLASLFLALLAVSTVKALQCFYTSSTDPNYKPLYRDSVSCGDSTTKCYKQTIAKNSTGYTKFTPKGAYYGCSTEYNNVCNGVYSKCVNKNGVNTCCCGTDLCNSAGLASFFPVVTVIIAVKKLF